MRKTIKVEKYPFPTGWEPAATYMIEGDDQKEVSAFFEDRCVSEKWGGVVGQWQIGMAIRAPDGTKNGHYTAHRAVVRSVSSY